MRGPRAVLGGLLERRASPVPLAVFRIAFALVCLLEVAQLFAFRRLLFDVVPGVEPAAPWVAPGLVAWMLALACLALGWRTRAAAAVAYAFAVAVLGTWAMRTGNDWHIDSGFITGLLVLLVSPAGEALSVDRLLARGRAAAAGRTAPPPAPVAPIHGAFLALAVGLMYWDSMLWKLTSEMYLAGLGFWAPASLPFDTFLDLSPLLGSEALVRAAGYLVLLFEGTFLLLVWHPRLRGPLVAIGIAFHVAILAAFPIPLFSLQMLAFYLGLVPARVYERIARRARRQTARVRVYFDEECPLCRRTAAVLDALDIAGGVRWLPLQRHAAHEPALARIEPRRLLADMHAVDDAGRVAAGAAAYARILRAMAWPAPLGWAIAVPPGSVVAAAVYSRIAARRARPGGGRCDDAACAPALEPPRRLAALAGRLRLERVVPAALLVVWLGSTAAIALASPFHRAWLPLAEETHARLDRIGGAWRAAVYPWTGFTAHGVFMDSHFARYTRQLVVVRRRDGVEEVLPTATLDGMAGRYGWGRQWVHWVFRTASPALPRWRRDASLRRWIEFWAASGGGAADGEIVVRERFVEVSLGEWREGLAERNRARPWRDVARVTGEPGALRIEWYPAASAALAEP